MANAKKTETAANQEQALKKLKSMVESEDNFAGHGRYAAFAFSLILGDPSLNHEKEFPAGIQKNSSMEKKLDAIENYIDGIDHEQQVMGLSKILLTPTVEVPKAKTKTFVIPKKKKTNFKTLRAIALKLVTTQTAFSLANLYASKSTKKNVYSDLSPKALEVQNYLNKTRFGCQQDRICMAVSIHLGEKILNHYGSEPSNDEGVNVNNLKQYSIVNYEDRPMMIIKPSDGDNVTAIEHDEDSYEFDDGDARIGSEEDCSNFISKMSDARIEKYFGFLESV